jgi:hypothetical protein
VKTFESGTLFANGVKIGAVSEVTIETDQGPSTLAERAAAVAEDTLEWNGKMRILPSMGKTGVRPRGCSRRSWWSRSRSDRKRFGSLIAMLGAT